MKLLELVQEASQLPGCSVLASSGQPKLNVLLPSDVQQFYELCGGMLLFKESPYSIRIVEPSAMKLANPEIMIGLDEADIEDTKDDISWFWYIIGEAENGQYVTIDLHPDRLGQCYDSFWDRHPTDVVVIARTFTELLQQLINNEGQHWYWLQNDFASLGSPYDE